MLLKTIGYLLILLTLNFQISSKNKKIDLPELNNPGTIDIGNGLICIGDGPSVMIYSVNNHKFLRKTGKKGEGPGEFIVAGGFSVKPQILESEILVNSKGKISFFDFNGVLKKEIKSGTLWSYKSCSNYIVGHSFKQENKISKIYLNLHSSQLIKLKELHQWSHAIQDAKKEIDLTPMYNDFSIFKTRVYYVKSLEADIEWYDTLTQKKGLIKLDIKRENVTGEYREKVIEFFKNDKAFSRHFSIIRKMFRFKDKFPAIKSFKLSDGKIYVQTYTPLKEKSRFVILSTKGKFIKEVHIPFEDEIGINILPKYSIEEDKIYQLVEDPDKNLWQLVINDI